VGTELDRKLKQKKASPKLYHNTMQEFLGLIVMPEGLKGRNPGSEEPIADSHKNTPSNA
jgi:hypothetical protein